MHDKNSNWHHQAIDHVLAELIVTTSGLSEAEAQKRLATHGPNSMPEAKKRNVLLRFLLQFHNILIYVLLASAAITAFLQHWLDTSVILAVVIANAIIGFIQEGKAEKAMDAIRHMLAPRANVLRDGVRRSIAGDTVVPGDILLLEAGDKVPADLRLISLHSLSIQEAILTGESVPVEKQIEPVNIEAPLGDRTCMTYSGTLVTSGQGKGIVIATGAETEIGRISGMMSQVETLTTPLVKQMDIFAKWLTLLILIVAALLLVYGYFVGHHEFSEMFMAVVGLSVAAIPEGLPAVLTITLAVGVQSMAKRNAIVRRLPAIETLGSVSVICTDKTGTLTRNEMMVTSVITAQHLFTLDGTGYEPKGIVLLKEEEIKPDEHAILDELARAASFCNDAAIREHNGNWLVEGDPMEGALLSFAGKVSNKVSMEQSAWTRTDEIPFDAKHRYMATLYHDHDNRAFIYVKGAPERILTMCQQQRSPTGGPEPLNETYWQIEADAIAALGQRVLAFAVRPVNPEHTVLEHEDLQGSLILLGMVGMIDPPRAEAIDAVQECHRAGIRVKMITGDHAKTAMAIGREIGLGNPDTVLTGNDLDEMSDFALKETVLHCDIFARTSPEHKLRLVMALQTHGMTVAMTGDGVNDAPALKRADAGIAMGKHGSEVAKEAAELVLADDNFASIVAAVREGRTVYDNIKKVISWTLPTNAGETMAIIVALLFGLTLPISPIQILWINLITGITLGLALAFEPTEENTMRRSPRPRNQPILTGELVWQILLVSVLFFCGVFGVFNYATDRGFSVELARTLVLNTLVIMEIAYLFFIRNLYGTSLSWQSLRSTKVVWVVVIVITFAQFAVTYFPPLQAIFATEPIPLKEGVLVVGIGFVLFIVLEIEKQIRLHLSSLT